MSEAVQLAFNRLVTAQEARETGHLERAGQAQSGGMATQWQRGCSTWPPSTSARHVFRLRRKDPRDGRARRGWGEKRAPGRALVLRVCIFALENVEVK